jgi:hypothetical protein
MNRRRPSRAPNPHDAYAKSVFRELPEAREFFCGYLPAKLVRLFDWSSLRLESESFVADNLAREFDEADLRGTEGGRLALAILKTVGEGRPLRWLQ